MARKDWWEHHEVSHQLLDLVPELLSGDYQVVDGADSLVALLNFVRLVLISEFPRKVEVLNVPQWSKLLGALASQVDTELATLVWHASRVVGSSLCRTAAVKILQ
mmetsp:Transcript_62618/g.167773  ORF Transcript_62618/g.167773 Transcript_62618/m.167773 type:complete len:105 (+) Transcript_62618:1374-1688(+)